jgi:metal-responsive CopG/Arc/MetJ family transcriptional regulator
MTDIATHREQRESIPVSLLLPPDLVARLDARVAEELISRSAWIRRTLNALLRPEPAASTRVDNAPSAPIAAPGR